MATRKKLEDKNLSILRELVAQPHNKKCFDCGQRGPTYVNMTIGAFVCTSCSGLLRGLNPPHRIKSISMATFAANEIEFLQNHGNEVCRNTWLALWDSNHAPEPESREEQRVKDFLIKKYERKVWYSSQPKQKPVQQQSAPETKTLKHLVGETSAEPTSNAFTASPPSQAQVQKQAPARLIEQQKKTESSGFDLLGDLGSDPFGSTSSTQSSSQGFASFDQAPAQQPFGDQPASFGTDSFADFSQSSNFAPNSMVNQNDPFSSVSAPSSSMPFDAFGQSSVQSAQTASNGFNAFSQQSKQTGSGSDPYKALSELDDVFRTSNTQSVFSSSTTGPNAMNVSANQHPNPFMSPASGTSGVAMFQQQQQMAQNPFDTGAGSVQSHSSGWGAMSSAHGISSASASAGGMSSFNTSQGNLGSHFQSGKPAPGQGFGATSSAFGTAQQTSFSSGNQGALAARQLNAFGSGQQAGIASGQQSTFGGQQGSSFGGQQGTFSGQQGTFGAQQGSFGGQQGSFSGQQGTFGAQQGSFGGQQGSFGGQQGSFGGQQGSFGGQQGSFGGQQGSFGGQQGSFGGQQGSFGGQQGSFGVQQSAFGGQQGTFSGQQGSFGGRQQSAFGAQSAQNAFGGGQQGLGGQQTFGGQQAFGGNPGRVGQQPSGLNQSFGGQQTPSGQISTSNQGFGGFGGQQPQQSFQGQQAVGKDAFGSFGSFGTQQQQQKQQQFGTWGQSNANTAGAFGMTAAQRSTNPFM